MLQKLETCMTQSPDVQGVTIDFGNAPAHGRWRAMSMTITLTSPQTGRRRVKWVRYTADNPRDGSGRHGTREPYERVIHIKLNTWELLE